VKKALIIILALCAIATAQQRRSLAVLPAVAENNALDPQGLILLTDKVREIASKTLPIDGFILLKQDAIVNRIGAEELFRACKEGVCVAELTKMIDADYGARCDIFRRDNSLLLRFELYSVNDDAILETFTEYDVNDFNGMRAMLDARLPNAFRKMMDAPKTRQSGYTVLFNDNGGSGLAPAPLTVERGSAITLPNQGGLRRNGGYFDGWNTNNSGTGENYSVGSSYAPTGNVTLYAKWVRVRYTVTFDANGGIGTAPAVHRVDTGSAITLPNQGDLTMYGYNFDGWNTDKSGAGENYSAGSPYTPTGNVTLYAKWNAEAAVAPAPEPRKTSWKSGLSIGGGGFLTADLGGGIAWGNGEYAAMPHSGGGGYVFFDAFYAEAAVGYCADGGRWESASASDLPYARRASVNIGVFAKLPFILGRTTWYPVLGVEWAASISGKLTYDDGTEYVFDEANGRMAANAMSALWVRFGAGIDFGLGQSIYLRAELLYGVRTAHEFEINDAADRNGDTRLGHGPTVKIGVGINLD